MRAALRAEGGGGGDHVRYVMDSMMDGKEGSTTSKVPAGMLAAPPVY